MARYLITPDVIRRGILHRHILNGDISGDVLIPWSVLTYLDKATAGDDISHEKFLKEVNNIRKASEAGLIKLEYIGQSTIDGDIYQYIFELSRDYDAVILTSDPSKAKFFQAVGSKVKLLSPIHVSEPVITKYFDEDTMSVHLKEGVRPRAKKGRPGSWLYVELDEKPITRDEILEIIDEILDYTKTDPESFIEIDEKGVTIVQMRNYRIIIAKPPFSDGYEITAVKPVKKLSLEDYNLPPELIRRLRERAEGILIAGAPGEGKSTFSQALAEFYRGMGKVVKTIESPRDLQLPMDITQYSKSYGDDKTLHDILLLSRPDYTIFDEMRTTEDFKLYVDLRLAGVGMIGVVHATRPIDAVQRFIERVELGMIPSVLDTVIFIKGGKVVKVYEIMMVAKVPHGLTREDLARPVVEVRDFFTKHVEYEFYVFGKRIFVIPVGREMGYEEEYYEVGTREMSMVDKIRRELGDIGEEFEIRMVGNKEAIIYVPPWGYREIRRALRRKTRIIKKKYGIKIDIEPMIGFE